MNRQCTIEPSIVNTTIWEYSLPQTGQYVSNLKFGCHPLITGVNFLNGYIIRTTIADIQSVEYIMDNQTLYTISAGPIGPIGPNVMTPIQPLYEVDLDFYRDHYIVTAALNPVKIRVTFQQAPVSPMWLSCTTNFTEQDTWTGRVLSLVNPWGQAYHY